jgi:hypothetical protein
VICDTAHSFDSRPPLYSFGFHQVSIPVEQQSSSGVYNSSTMTIPLSSDPLIMSPISRVPYDVLREIFIHCLPRYRLRVRQPNTEIAPMLLCHICSAWRTVALGSMILWSHLSYRLVVASANFDPVSRTHDWRFLKHQLPFLSWWRRNQGTITPSLCLNVTSDGLKTSELEPDAVTTSLFQYIASAQYLETNDFFWRILCAWNKVGCRDVYPNPHTLVKSSYERFDYFYHVQDLIPNHTPSMLRYLSLNDDILFDTLPNNWSKLTRIALDRVETPLDTLLFFIRSVPYLQWAHFDILLSIREHTPHFPPCTLPHLSTFCIMLRYEPSLILKIPLSTVFTNFHLPALHTLSLSTSQESWFDCDAIPELYAVLKSSPAVTTLTLGGCFSP